MPERIYCSEQIKIPAAYPEIMKQYCKAVLAEQPVDIIDFSIKYFAKLVSEKQQPVQIKYEPDVKELKNTYITIQNEQSTQLILQALKTKDFPEQLIQQLNTWVQFAHQQIKDQAISELKLVYILLFCIVSPDMFTVLQNMFMILQVPDKKSMIKAEDCIFMFKVLSKLDYRIEKNAIDVVKELCQQGNDVVFDEVVGKLGITKK